jgi:tetrahydromethanopterin S-methyltransferase subunit G
MEAMRESWTDDRLDYLNHKVDDGFAHVDVRVGQFEKRADERFDDVNRRLDEGNERMARMESRLDQLSQSLIDSTRSNALASRAIVVTQVIGFLTILVATL